MQAFDMSVIDIERARNVLKKLGKIFSNREFIAEYSRQYEADYIDSLLKYRGRNSFKSVHQQIAIFLEYYKDRLEIKKITKRKISKNIVAKIADKGTSNDNIVEHTIKAKYWEK